MAYVETDEFVRAWNKAKSVADLSRKWCWRLSKVKATRTRINNSIAKQAWFNTLSDDDKAKVQLKDLQDFTDSQAKQEAKQASEGFASNINDVLSSFGIKQGNIKFG